MTPEIQELLVALEAEGYVAEPATATAVFLAREMRKPLLVEGDAGVGKTELAKVLARLLGTELIRLQCYEGLDVQTALYEWDYPRQLLRLRMSDGRGEDPQDFEDYVDDDGRGFGPYKVKVTIWRKGDKAYFDYTGTDPQSEGPINYYLNIHLLKMFIGVYLIMTYDPQILFNDGFYPLLEINIPKGTLLNPEHPAALGCRTHVLGRQFDILGGALCKKAPQFLTGAGWGSSPHMIYSGYDAEGKWFNAFEIGFGGIPARPFADGMDGHAMWPLFTNQPAELMETYYPMRIEQYTSVIDSGGAGYHRGGNGLLKVYHFLAEGEVSIHDDRWLTYQWGVNGGAPALRGKKWLKRKSGKLVPIPSKCDHVKVAPGDELYCQTWGGGGYGDPLTRELERVEKDVRRRLVSLEKAKASYGVAIDPKTLAVDRKATEKLRAELKQKRGEPKPFDFGPPLAEILRNCRKETGLAPPKPPVFKKLVASMPVYKPKASGVRVVPREIADQLLKQAATGKHAPRVARRARV